MMMLFSRYQQNIDIPIKLHTQTGNWQLRTSALPSTIAVICVLCWAQICFHSVFFLSIRLLLLLPFINILHHKIFFYRVKCSKVKSWSMWPKDQYKRKTKCIFLVQTMQPLTANFIFQKYQRECYKVAKRMKWMLEMQLVLIKWR